MSEDNRNEVPAPVSASPSVPDVRREATDPPVVARLVVEIRSDGSRTIARGALEDTTTGDRTTVEARGTTPLNLMVSLSRAFARIPSLATKAARALLPARRLASRSR